MKRKTIGILSLIAIICLAVVGVVYAQIEEDKAQKTPQTDEISEMPSTDLPQLTSKSFYTYTAKFVCGDGSASKEAVAAPAKYYTAINVHNPQGYSVKIQKKVAQAANELENPIPPSAKHTYEIKPDYAFEIDCKDIQQIAYPAGGAPPFMKGFVVIETPRQIDVTGVYSSIGITTTGSTSGLTLDVENVAPKITKPSISTYAADLPVD